LNKYNSKFKAIYQYYDWCYQKYINEEILLTDICIRFNLSYKNTWGKMSKGKNINSIIKEAK